MNYGMLDIMQTLRALPSSCTGEEIDAFYKEIGEYSKLLDQD